MKKLKAGIGKLDIWVIHLAHVEVMRFIAEHGSDRSSHCKPAELANDFTATYYVVLTGVKRVV